LRARYSAKRRLLPCADARPRGLPQCGLLGAFLMRLAEISASGQVAYHNLFERSPICE